jgi:plastocyanin
MLTGNGNAGPSGVADAGEAIAMGRAMVTWGILLALLGCGGDDDSGDEVLSEADAGVEDGIDVPADVSDGVEDAGLDASPDTAEATADEFPDAPDGGPDAGEDDAADVPPDLPDIGEDDAADVPSDLPDIGADEASADDTPPDIGADEASADDTPPDIGADEASADDTPPDIGADEASADEATADDGGLPWGDCAVSFAGCASFVDRTAAGASRTVSFAPYSYTPACLTILAGQTVTFSGSFGGHPLAQACGPVAVLGASGGSSAAFTFPTPGIYGYYCTAHGTPSGGGMAGAIYVQ